MEWLPTGAPITLDKILQILWRKIQFKITKSLKYNSEIFGGIKLRHLSCYYV